MLAAAGVALLIAVQVIVVPPGSANVTASITNGYPVIYAVLQNCPTQVEAKVNGVYMGGVPFKAEPLDGGGCNVTVDLRGLATFTVYPGDNLTLTYMLGGGNVSASIIVEAQSQQETIAAGGGVDEPVYVGNVSVGRVGGDNTPRRTVDRNAWLAASIMLAAAALMVGAREYGGRRGG